MHSHPMLLALVSACLTLTAHAWHVQQPCGRRVHRPECSAARESEPLLRNEELPALLQMARPNTIPMGAGLVGFGAFGARRTGFTTLPVGRLVLGALLTIIVTSGSMLINDYHDFREGVDTAETKPGRPLVTGAVRRRSRTRFCTTS